MRETPAFRDLPEHEQRAQALAARLRVRDRDAVTTSVLPRWPYVVQGVRVLVTEPNFAQTTLYAVTRDLSAKGVTFVHRRYVHAGTSVAIELMKLDSMLVLKDAVIVGSAYHSDGLHLIAAEFSAPVIASEFIIADDV